MRGSGTYVTLIDNSFKAVGLATLGFIVPGLSQKGDKYTIVTKANYKDLLGYDLAYNPRILGVGQLLDQVSQLTFMRLNKGAAFCHAVVLEDGANFYSNTLVTDLDVLDLAVNSLAQTENIPLSAPSKVITLSSPVVPGSLVIKENGATIATQDVDGVINLVGSPTHLTAGVLSGKTLTLTIPVSSGSTQFEISWAGSASKSIIVAAKTPGDQGLLSASLTKETRTTEFLGKGASVSGILSDKPTLGTVIVKDVNGVALGDDSATPGTIVGVDLTGTVDAEGNVSLSFGGSTFPVGYWVGGAVIQVQAVPVDWKYIVKTFSRTISGTTTFFTPLETVLASRNPDDIDYIGLRSMSEYVQVKILDESHPPLMEAGAVTPFPLSAGANGTMPAAAEIDLSDAPFDQFSIAVMNGIYDTAVISKFISVLEARRIVTLYGFPNYKNFLDARDWKKSIKASQYQAGTWVSDNQTIGSHVYSICPSINMATAYAQMFAATGSLNYPPAGYDFGGQSIESLLQTDVANYAAQAKLEAINYLTIRGGGPVLWEQRTGYAKESDLKYLSSVFTFIDLAKICATYMDNFNFRYITQEMVMVISNGLNGIGQRFLSNGFLWSFDAQVPSFAEIKRLGGREMVIPIVIKFAEDGEEYTLQFEAAASA
jgi:hypothetical protein